MLAKSRCQFNHLPTVPYKKASCNKLSRCWSQVSIIMAQHRSFVGRLLVGPATSGRL